MEKTATTTNHHSESKLKPEWVRVPDAIRISGLCRSSIYQLIQAGKIKSFSNRQRGERRGIRLISYDSLIGFIEKAYAESIAEKEVAND
jgi:hypothetical protein